MHDAIYDLFILGTTIYSLMVIALLFIWPLTPAARSLLIRIDALICAIFVVDLVLNLIRSPNWRIYFFRQWGWLDLLGSVPVIVAPPWAGILRLARLPRLVSIARDLRAKDSGEIRRELRGDPELYCENLSSLESACTVACYQATVFAGYGLSS